MFCNAEITQNAMNDTFYYTDFIFYKFLLLILNFIIVTLISFKMLLFLLMDNLLFLVLGMELFVFGTLTLALLPDNLLDTPRMFCLSHFLLIIVRLFLVLVIKPLTYGTL